MNCPSCVLALSGDISFSVGNFRLPSLPTFPASFLYVLVKIKAAVLSERLHAVCPQSSGTRPEFLTADLTKLQLNELLHAKPVLKN